MKILFLSFYYHPDYSAGSYRNTALVNALQKKLSKDDCIQVFTTSPNRYGKFDFQSLENKENDNVSVTRIDVTSKSSFFSQVIAFLQYAFSTISHTKKNEYDLIYASSGRLMTAALGAYLARSKNTSLYLDIRDIFYDSFKDSFCKLKFLLPIIAMIERYTIRSANHINLVSPGFETYFLKKYPDKKYSFYLNGIDKEFFDKCYSLNEEEKSQEKILLYVGNIGIGQDLNCIIPELSQDIKDVWKIKIIGAGNSENLLKATLRRMKIDNVEILPPVKRDELIEIYKQSSCLFLHLNRSSVFKNPLPSKIFEYAATGKPILAGVQGYAKNFINENIENVGIFPPCSSKLAVHQLNNLNLSLSDRSNFIEKFSRNVIMDRMSTSVIKVGGLEREKIL